MKIGLFGGSFDPIHKGHLHIARAFADELALNTVLFLPAGEPYHKNSPQTSAQQRLEMVQEAIAQDERFAVSNVDMIRHGATYTIDTINIFKQIYPSDQLWWLMGMDSLMQLHTWKNWQVLVRQTHIAVAARSGQNLAHIPTPLQEWLIRALHQGEIKLLNASIMDISSSQIRQAMVKGNTAYVQKCVTPAVWDMIQHNHLYTLK